MKKFLSWVLSGILVATPLMAQQQPPVFVPGASPEPVPVQGPALAGRGLKIYVLVGRSGFNRIRDGVTAVPVIEIRDRDDIPQEGVNVVIEVPKSGPSATFPGGATQRSFRTNVTGQVVADGFTPNQMLGKFSVLVSADNGINQAKLSFQQENTNQTLVQYQAAKKNAWRKWAYIGAAAAGGIVAAVILTRSSGSSTPNVSVNPGTVIIGGR